MRRPGGQRQWPARYCNVRENTNLSFFQSTGTTSLGPNFPSRIIRDNGFSTYCCMARRKGRAPKPGSNPALRSEEHTSALQSLMRIPYAVLLLKKKNNKEGTST